MTRYLLFIIPFIFFSCKTEEDKYPEMVVFDPNMKGDFIFEEIEPIPKYFRDTDTYVFFLTDNSTPKSRVVIYDKKSKRLVRSLALSNNHIHITSNSSIYGFDGKTEKAFKYLPPKFEKKYLEKNSLSHIDYESLKKEYTPEIKSKKLEGQRLYDFLDKKRYEILKKEIIDSLVCITTLYKSNTAIAHYKHKDIYVENSDYLYKGTFIKSKLKGVKDCSSSNFELDKSNYFNKSPLTLIEHVTLDYNFTGSNHFVIGVNSSDLYYYELILKEKSKKFKSPYPINNIMNLENLVILETANKYYKVSTKE
ncbi:hypothetical protein [Tenacibaculum sp.]|uniref:hypothetical protein n=1 Tax=Tenacibaculum sp. TaxID=1906242 RepID=UPI003D1203B7